MSYSLDRYRYYKGKDNKIVAVSSYAGKTVKGVAKCDPRDEYDESSGKKLAALRCNLKVATKREARAKKMVIEAQKELNAAQARYDKMSKYFKDAYMKKAIAEHDLTSFESTL